MERDTETAKIVFYLVLGRENLIKISIKMKSNLIL